MSMLFVYILVYVLQLIKITLESIPEISRCCFSNEAIKTAGKGISYNKQLPKQHFVTLLSEEENTC